MMTYEEFKEQLCGALSEHFGNEISMEFADVKQNNNCSYEGLHIFSEKERTMPVFNTEGFYQSYAEGSITFEAIVKMIMEEIRNMDIRQTDAVYRLGMLEEVRENVYFALINYDANREALQELPHERFLDLAVVLYVCIRKDDESYYSMIVSNALLKFWQTDFEELFTAAKRNSVEKQPVQIYKLGDMIQRDIDYSLRKLAESDRVDEEGLLELLMMMALKNVMETGSFGVNSFFMTNSVKRFGAACILYPEALEKLAEKVGADVFIIPVSIDEVLLVPDDGENGSELRERIAAVAKHNMKGRKWLSNSLYFYRRKGNEIEIYDEQ